MVITLTGPNTFAVQTKLNQLVSEFVKEYTEMGLERLDGEEVEYDQIREALEGLPFLASKKLVVLRAPSANKDFVEKAENLLANLSESTDVIIVEPKLDKRSVYYKFLQKKTDYKEFSELDEQALSKWLAGEVKTKAGTLNNSDAHYLIERLGTNQQLLASELTKLLTYDNNITRQSIDLLTEPTPQSTIFQLIDTAMSGNRSRTMKLYAEQRAQKAEPPAIIALLAWQLHAMAVIKSAGERDAMTIAKEAALNPYVVRKNQTLVRNISLQRIKQLITKLRELDQQIKTTSIDADDALQTYLLELA